jgi:hypothetical protein
VSKLCFEPRVGLAVLYEMLAPYLASGRVGSWCAHRPISVATDGDVVRAVTVKDEITGATRTLGAPYILDGTELGDVLELGGVESVIGAEARAETGEPLALEGPANPREQMVFTPRVRARAPSRRGTRDPAPAGLRFLAPGAKFARSLPEVHPARPFRRAGRPLRPTDPVRGLRAEHVEFSPAAVPRQFCGRRLSQRRDGRDLASE